MSRSGFNGFANSEGDGITPAANKQVSCFWGDLKVLVSSIGSNA